MRLSHWIHPDSGIGRIYVNDLLSTGDLKAWFLKAGEGFTFHASGTYSILASTEQELERLILKRLKLDGQVGWSDLMEACNAQPSKYPTRNKSKASKTTSSDIVIKDAEGKRVEFSKRGNTITLKGIVR